MRSVKACLVAALLSIACGFPLYLLLMRTGVLPLSLHGAPWPLELASLMAALATAILARRGAWRSMPRLARGAVVLSLLSVEAFMGVVRGFWFRLPSSSPEVATGSAMPEFSLTTQEGLPLALSELRGHAVLVVFFRSAW